jgi:hypothetical protein
MEVPGAAGSPLYLYGVGLILALAFAWVLGFGATIAEPALNALGVTAEQLTNGFFKKRMLILAVSVGVACGIALGLTKLIFDLPLVWLIVPPYLLAAVLTAVSSEEFVNVAWDSAGVTTGPITVPLVLAMGLGFGNATQAVEGFGILCLASIGPIISVLLTGLWARAKAGCRSGRPVRANDRSSAGGPITGMKDDKITYLTDVALITCIVAAGRGDAVIKAAQAMGAAGALVYHARGIGPRERLGLLGIAVEAEKDVVSILVATDYQDAVFEAVYRAGELNAPAPGWPTSPRSRRWRPTSRARSASGYRARGRRRP